MSIHVQFLNISSDEKLFLFGTLFGVYFFNNAPAAMDIIKGFIGR